MYGFLEWYSAVTALASLTGLHGTTTGKDIFLCVWNHEGTSATLDISKGVTTDRIPSMTGKKTDLIGGISWQVEKQNPKLSMQLHCIIYWISLWKNFKVWLVTKVVDSVVELCSVSCTLPLPVQFFLS